MRTPSSLFTYDWDTIDTLCMLTRPLLNADWGGFLSILLTIGMPAVLINQVRIDMGKDKVHSW